jgi:acetoacetyl-CoA synthetase
VSPPETPLWTPSPARREQANVTRFLAWLAVHRGLELTGYSELWRFSTEELEDFWAAVWAFHDVRSRTPYERVLADRSLPGSGWFVNARLNYAEHVLDRAGQAAAGLVYVTEAGLPVELSAATLRQQVGSLAASLRELGVERGDRVAAYLPNIPEAVIALLATASLGAVWSACAPDFGTRSVIDRFAQIEPKVLIAVDGYLWGGREHDRTATIAELQAALPTVKATIAVRSLHPEAPLPSTLNALHFDECRADPQEPHFEPVEFDHPLWILFSSGTTGLPKGIVQSQGGILLEHLKSLGLCLDLKPQDRYFFFSSTSWMAWNYLVGGLLHGSTIVLYNGAPTLGGQDWLWRVAEKTQSTVLGMGSAYAAGCQKAGVALGELELGAVRTVIPTGAPLAASGWRWLSQQLGPEVRIDSICGGTDVCTAFFGGSELLPVRLGQASCRWLGIAARAYDPQGQELIDEVGEFVVTEPMPSMPVGLWNDPAGQRYRAAYFERFPGVWSQGDWITITHDGFVTIHGRSDATLNRGGVRLGSAELYGVVEALPEVSDSLVIGLELADGGYYMPMFVVSDVENQAVLEALIADSVRAQLSPRHVPDEVIRVPAIPRTLTGKKLEIPVKRMLQGVPADRAAATGSIDRPDAYQWFARFAAARRLELAGG